LGRWVVAEREGGGWRGGRGCRVMGKGEGGGGQRVEWETGGVEGEGGDAGGRYWGGGLGGGAEGG